MHKLFFIFLGLGLVTTNVFASSLETHLCIQNNTSSSHIIDVEAVSTDWFEGDSRPDKNFANRTIYPGQTLCEREEVTSYFFGRWTNVNFSIDGNKVPMSVYNYSNWSSPGWGSYSNWTSEDNTSLVADPSAGQGGSGYSFGYKCSNSMSDPSCSLFKIYGF